MTNYSDTELRFECDEPTFDAVVRPLLSGRDCNGTEREVTFNILIPMPENIYRDSVGSKVRETYGQANWFDWSCKHWGTKWDAIADGSCIKYPRVWISTAWCPPRPWLVALARALEPHGIKAHANCWSEGSDYENAFSAYELSDGVVLAEEPDEKFKESYKDIYEEETEEEE